VPLDIQVQDTYWIVGHIHYVLFGGSVLGIFSAMYFFFPDLTGRMYDERLGKAHFYLTFIGLNLTYLVMHYLGLEGMPRRIWDPPDQFLWGNQLSMVGAMILGACQLIFFYNMLHSMRHGPEAPADPWE